MEVYEYDVNDDADRTVFVWEWLRAGGDLDLIARAFGVIQ